MASFSYLGGQKRRRSRKQRQIKMHQFGKQRQKKQRPVPQNKGKSSQQNKGSLTKTQATKRRQVVQKQGSLAKTKAIKRRQTVQKRRQRLAVGHWKFHDSLGAENHALQKKMPWRNGTSALVHQCDTHLWVAGASNFAPPYNFYEAGPNFGLPFSVVANPRTRFQSFHGARPFTPPCTKNRVDDVSSESGDEVDDVSAEAGSTAMLQHAVSHLPRSGHVPSGVVVGNGSTTGTMDCRNFWDFMMDEHAKGSLSLTFEALRSVLALRLPSAKAPGASNASSNESVTG